MTYEQRVNEMAVTLIAEMLRITQSHRADGRLWESLSYSEQNVLIAEFTSLAQIAVDAAAEGIEMYERNKYGYTKGIDEYVKATTERYLIDNGYKPEQ